MSKLFVGIIGGSGSALGYAASALMSKGKGSIAPVAVQNAMPDPDDAAISAARRRRLAQMQNRGGRQSTILSQSETLGGS